MTEIERRNGSITLPLVRLPLPNPLGWVPRPRMVLSRKPRRSVTTEDKVVITAATATAVAAPTASVTAATTATAGSTAAATAAVSKVPLKPASDVLCGALARAASQSTIHPIDTLKVRMQARSRTVPAAGVSKIGQLVPPAGAAPAARPTFKEVTKTVASLYKGVFGAASGAGIAIGAYFALYGAACNMLSRNTDLAPSAVAFVAGGTAAIGSSVVKVPLAVCIRSVQAGVYPNVFAAAKTIVAQAGPRGLFTGLLPTVLEDVPDMAIKFAAYETMRQVHSKLNNGRKASPHEDFAMGAIAGSVAAAASTPLDVIKTNMMCCAASRPSMMEAARAVYENGGAKAFFRGVGPRSISNGINSAVFFVFFEALRASVAQAKAQGVTVDSVLRDAARKFEEVNPIPRILHLDRGVMHRAAMGAGVVAQPAFALAAATVYGQEALLSGQDKDK